MAQEPFIQSPQTETSVRQAFEDYIQSKKIEAEGKGQTWAAEKKYRTSLKLIEDAGIVLDNMSLKELNTEERIEQIMTNERLLDGKKTVRGDRTFGKGNIRDLGNHLNTIFNNLRAGEANALASWNAKNKGKPNPNPKGPFKTLGFALTERDIPGQIKTAPDAVMLKAFRDTLNDIQDVQVGKTTIPAKTVKAHMLMSVVTGMRSPDINNFVSQIDPSEEQLKATDSVKTFLRSDDKVMVINNKGKLTEYALNPTLYSILSDATQSASGEKVFPSAASIEKSYLDILQNKLTQAGYPAIKQNVKGVLKDVPLSHNILRKFAFSFVERIPEAEGGGTSNADALIQHKTKDRSIGETTYRAGTLGEFQTTKETTAQSAFIRRLLPETTPAQFLEQQGFNSSNFVTELYNVQNEGDLKILGGKESASFLEKQVFRASLDADDTLGNQAKENIIEQFGHFPNAKELAEADRKTIENGYAAYVEAMRNTGSTNIVDEENYYNAVKAETVQPISTVQPPVATVAAQQTSAPAVSEEPELTKREVDFTDTSRLEGSEPTVEEQRRRSSDLLRQMREGAVDFVKDKGPKALLGAATGGAGLLANIADAAADVALSPTELGYGGLDPAEKLMGTPTSDISDEELLERMQAASSQRLSPDMAERTTALADIEANREGLQARAFSPIAKQQVEQSQRDQRESGLGDYGETTQAESMRQVLSDVQDVDTSEAFTEQAQRARIAAQAAQLFNR